MGNNTYVYKQDNVDVTPGKYYQSTVSMAKASAEITVTITQNDLPPTGYKSFTKDGVTVTANDIVSSLKTILGPGSFTTTLGNFTKIEVTGDDKPTGTGWTSGVWTGNASTVEFTGGSIAGFMSDAFTIVCTIQPAEATTVNLSNLTADYEAKNGDVLKGELGANVKISIADGATVTLDGVSINAKGTWKRGNYAGITCEGAATIILKDGSTNTVKGFYNSYPGIFIASGKTLTIKGTGSLTTSSNGYGAGIGGGYETINCGNIEIQGGTITATGGNKAAGIGSGYKSSCGNIIISGGSVTATGGANGAGIGSGSDMGASCGNITITTGATQVTATKGDFAESIGAGNGGSCGTVTIGNSTGTISTSPYTYTPSSSLGGGGSLGGGSSF